MELWLLKQALAETEGCLCLRQTSEPSPWTCGKAWDKRLRLMSLVGDSCWDSLWNKTQQTDNKHWDCFWTHSSFRWLSRHLSAGLDGTGGASVAAGYAGLCDARQRLPQVAAGAKPPVCRRKLEPITRRSNGSRTTKTNAFFSLVPAPDAGSLGWARGRAGNKLNRATLFCFIAPSLCLRPLTAAVPFSVYAAKGQRHLQERFFGVA
jgi:hypothetical protein